MDEHPHLIDEVRRDLEVIAANKRMIPERKAAIMGEKRRKFGDADFSQLLETSEEEDIVDEKNDTHGCKDMLQKQLIIKKECKVKISKLILKERKFDFKLQSLNLTGADDYLENVESHENYNDDDSIIIETASDSSAVEQTPSSHQFFNQPDTGSPQEGEYSVKLQKLCLAGANDDCENVVIDENDTDDESILVETATDSSVIELSPSSHQLSNQPDTSTAQYVDSGAESRDLSSLAPVMVDKDKVQWWFEKFV